MPTFLFFYLCWCCAWNFNCVALVYFTLSSQSIYTKDWPHELGAQWTLWSAKAFVWMVVLVAFGNFPHFNEDGFGHWLIRCRCVCECVCVCVCVCNSIVLARVKAACLYGAHLSMQNNAWNMAEVKGPCFFWSCILDCRIWHMWSSLREKAMSSSASGPTTTQV